MLFNSPVFIFLFLPISFLVYFMLCRRGLVIAGIAWLVFASLYFYRYWHPAYLVIILSSLGVNYAIGTALCQLGRRQRPRRGSRLTRNGVLTAGLLFNFGLLGYYKYADFALANFNQLTGASLILPNVVLPLGISFFTFQQVAYLVDCRRDNAEEYNLLNYCLFITFFPQLIAGPIVHHHEVMPQFNRLRNQLIDYRNVALGMFFFAVGLAKKVCIADQFSVWARQGFSTDTALGFFDAWGTSLSYTLQLYFDFSGYSDMAIGAALLFNIRLPINFDSPYQAKSIQEFWRRWHITLSRWLRDYIYIPLGGNRSGPGRTCVNILVTFLLGGLWHGAGWTFVLWGALHGGALVIHRLWERAGLRLPRFCGWLLTFLFVNAAWVFFRAETFAKAMAILQAMAGMNGLALPRETLNLSAGFASSLAGMAVGPSQLPLAAFGFILLFGLVAFLLPNSGMIGGFIAPPSRLNCTTEVTCRFLGAPLRLWTALTLFRPSLPWAILTMALLCASLHRLLRVAPSEFLYFNF